MLLIIGAKEVALSDNTMSFPWIVDDHLSDIDIRNFVHVYRGYGYQRPLSEYVMFADGKNVECVKPPRQ